MNALKYKDILDEFEMCHGDIAQHAVDWCPNGMFEIIVTLDDGNKVIYNRLRSTIRYLRSSSCNGNPSDKDLCKIFALRLERFMRIRRMTQAELAHLTGISRATINAYIQWKTIPTICNVSRIAKVLNCSISELLELQD